MLDYETCVKLKELGYPQKKYRYAKYYITKDLVIDFETAHDIWFANSRRMNNIYDEVDWTNTLVYIPTLEDLIGEKSYDVTLNSAVIAWLDTRGREYNAEELVNTTIHAIKDKDENTELVGEKINPHDKS